MRQAMQCVVLILGGATWACASAQEWQTSFIPYVWGGDLRGTLNTARTPPLDVHKSFSDTLSHMDIGGMAVLEVRRGDWGVLADGTWLETSEDVALPLGLQAALETRMRTLAVLGEYRAITGDRGQLDVLAGARWWSLRADIALQPALISDTRVESDWVDPLLGVRARWQASERSVIEGWVQGTVVRDPSWDLMLSWGYRVTPRSWLRVGWRQQSIRRQTRLLDFDGDLSGPGIGWQFNFR